MPAAATPNVEVALACAVAILLACGGSGSGVADVDAAACDHALCDGIGAPPVSLLDGGKPPRDAGQDAANAPSDLDASAAPDANTTDSSTEPVSPDATVEDGKDDAGPTAAGPVTSLVGTWNWESRQTEECSGGQLVSEDSVFEAQTTNLQVHENLTVSSSYEYALVSSEDGVLEVEAVIPYTLDNSLWRSVVRIWLVSENAFEGERRLFDVNGVSQCSGGVPNRQTETHALRGTRL